MDDDLKLAIEKMQEGYKAVPTKALEHLAHKLWDELFHPDARPYDVETQVKRLKWVIILNILKDRAE